MNAQSYAGVSEEEFAAFVRTYRGLCANTWWIYLVLYLNTVSKWLLYASWFEVLWRRPLAGVALTAAGLPLLIYFIITFCRLPPPVTPRTFRHLLLFAIAWDSVGTVMLSALSFYSWAQRGSLDSVLKTPLLISVAACVCLVSVLLKYHSRFRQQVQPIPAAEQTRDGA